MEIADLLYQNGVFVNPILYLAVLQKTKSIKDECSCYTYNRATG